MRRSLLDLLACPEDRAPLVLEEPVEEDPRGRVEEESGGRRAVPGGAATGPAVPRRPASGRAAGAKAGGAGDAGDDAGGAGSDDEVVAGTLRCTECGFGYPVEAGIPNLLPKEFHRDEVQDAREAG